MLVYKGQIKKKQVKPGVTKAGKSVTYHSFILSDGTELYPMRLSVSEKTYNGFEIGDEVEIPVKYFTRGENAFTSFMEDIDDDV